MSKGSEMEAHDVVETPDEKLTVATPSLDTFSSSEDVTIVASETSVWKEICKISKHLRDLIHVTNKQAEYVEQIPEVKHDVKESKKLSRQALQAVEVIRIRFETRLSDMNRRVEKVESEKYECSQGDVIKELKNFEVATRVKVDENVQDTIRVSEKLDGIVMNMRSYISARRNFLLGLIGVFVFVATSLGSLIWFLSSLSTEVELERKEWVNSHKRLEKQMGVVSKGVDTTSVERELRILADVVRSSEESEESVDIEVFCDSLSDSTVRRMQRMVPRDEWPECSRFVP